MLKLLHALVGGDVADGAPVDDEREALGALAEAEAHVVDEAQGLCCRANFFLTVG